MDPTTRATTPKGEGDKHEEGKVINDPIHGTMYFNSLLIRIIDTPEFQRLRDIKQLGGTSFVYPGGVHTRFDHSLGTCHITGVFLKYLKERNPQMSSILTDKKRICIKIAALCHDLGQGPFSRVYQDQFLGRLKEVDWSHTENSLKIFDMICLKPSVVKAFKDYQIEDADINFIKKVIQGDPDSDKANRFLYEIVCNKRNGIDCDTFDKILRDSFYVGVKHSFNHIRIMECAKIVKVKLKDAPHELRICFRYKEQLCLREMYDSWCKLQQIVYTHKTTRAIEMMIAEAMEKVDEYFKISEARDEPGKLLLLSDSILHQISRAHPEVNEGLKAARAILERINNRNLYQFCGQTSPLPTEEEARFVQSGFSLSFDHDGSMSPGLEERRRQKELRQRVTSGILSFPKFSKSITENDLLVEVIGIRYGNGRNDPLDNINFVDKECKVIERSPNAKSFARPTFMKAYKEEFIRVYAREKGKIKEIINRFYRWCEDHEYDVPKDMDKTPIENDETEYQSSSVARRLDFDEGEEQEYGRSRGPSECNE